MKKFLAFVEASERDEVNAWIDENIENAGPNTFSAPYGSTEDGEITHYACCWRINDTDRAAVEAYLASVQSKTMFKHVEPERFDAEKEAFRLKARKDKGDYEKIR